MASQIFQIKDWQTCIGAIPTETDEAAGRSGMRIHLGPVNLPQHSILRRKTPDGRFPALGTNLRSSHRRLSGVTFSKVERHVACSVAKCRKYTKEVRKTYYFPESCSCTYLNCTVYQRNINDCAQQDLKGPATSCSISFTLATCKPAWMVYTISPRISFFFACGAAFCGFKAA